VESLKLGKGAQVILPNLLTQLHVNELRGFSQIDKPGLIQLFDVVRERSRRDGEGATQMAARQFIPRRDAGEDLVASGIGDRFGDAVKPRCGHSLQF
jgi:hypothetical protein